MIGDEYLESKAALASVLSELTSLAHDLDADEQTRRTLLDLNRSLDEPFLFVVVGEVKAGKSSLLNALFGEEFCRVDVLPATDKVYLFKHAPRAQDVNISERLAECHRPNAFLKNFNIVDTPGTNTIVEDHQTISEDFLPRADLVLFVFSVVNPWAASAWEFLKHVHRKWLKNVVFVVQQADLRTPVEVQAVVEHLDATVQRQFGEKLSIFPVSARKAFDARTGAPEAEQLLAESGLPELERHIEQTVTEGTVRREKLRSVARSCLVVQEALRGKLESAFAVLRRDGERLDRLRDMLEERKGQSRRQIGGVLYALSQSYEKAQKRAEELLREKLSIAQTLKLIFRKADWQRDFQADVEERLKDEFQRQIAHSLELLEEDLKGVWRQLHERLQEDFSGETKGPATMPDFLDRRTALLKRIELTLLEKMSSREIDRQMQRMFSETANILRLPAGVAAAAGGAAALAAALAQGALVDVTGTIAGLAAVVGTVVAVVKRRRILEQFSREMRERREAVLTAIESQLEHAVDLFYQELNQTFEPLRNFCMTQQKKYEPLLERASGAGKELAKVQADLG